MKNKDIKIKHEEKQIKNEDEEIKQNEEERIFPHEPKERKSLLDDSRMHGFLNLIWVFVVMWSILHMIGQYKRIGYPIDFTLFHILTRDWTILIILWIGISLYTLFVSVTFEFILSRFQILEKPISFLFVLFQLFQLCIPGLYAIYRPHASVMIRAALCMQSFVLMMKQHSYFMFNYYARRKRKNERTLIELAFHYHEFLWMPSLIYEEDFPRKENVNWTNVIIDLCCALFLTLVSYQLFDSFIYPVILDRNQYNLFEASMILAPSTLAFWMIGFYTVFHCFLNALAEITRLSDREFYLEWWNATCMSEFWRLWNRSVYKWMARHIYVESLRTVKHSLYSKTLAAIGTQIVTAVFHEYVLVVAFNMFRPIFFFIICLQIPYGILTERFKGTRLGNVIMWVGLMTGFPVLELSYAYFYVHQ